MDGMNPYDRNDSNPYMSTYQIYEQAAARQQKRKKKKIAGMILILLGLMVMAAGGGAIFLGSYGDVLETAEPVDIYNAGETDEYAYTYIQYMTDPVAYYEVMDKLQFYIVMDSDWSPTVVCLHEDQMEPYRPFIDWLYSDSYDNEPAQVRVTGYAQPFDDELKQFVLEGFAHDFGEGIVDEDTFYDFFGEYYLQIGRKNNAYGITSAGIIAILAAIVMIVIGCGLILEQNGAAAVQDMSGPVIEKSGSVGLGILGALLGAVLGGLLWTVIGVLGYISGWVGILIIFFANKGYQMFSKREDRIGLVFSIIFGFLVVVPATFLTYGWNYYCFLNVDMSGYTSLARAMLELPGYMKRFGLWPKFVIELAMGYVFMIIVGIFGLVANGKKSIKSVSSVQDKKIRDKERK